MAFHIPSEKSKFPGDEAKLTSLKIYQHLIQMCSWEGKIGHQQWEISHSPLTGMLVSQREECSSYCVLTKSFPCRPPCAWSLRWKSVLSLFPEGSCFCLPPRSRMGPSDFKSSLCGNLPTVLRSYKMLDIHLQNQMMRWAL